MERYKKYRTIQKISYIIFFLYLLVLALGNISFGEYAIYIPYCIVIPFIIYCATMITTEVLISKSRKALTYDEKEEQDEEPEYNKVNTTTLSKI